MSNLQEFLIENYSDKLNTMEEGVQPIDKVPSYVAHLHNKEEGLVKKLEMTQEKLEKALGFWDRLDKSRKTEVLVSVEERINELIEKEDHWLNRLRGFSAERDFKPVAMAYTNTFRAKCREHAYEEGLPTFQDLQRQEKWNKAQSQRDATRVARISAQAEELEAKLQQLECRAAYMEYEGNKIPNFLIEAIGQKKSALKAKRAQLAI